MYGDSSWVNDSTKNSIISVMRTAQDRPLPARVRAFAARFAARSCELSCSSVSRAAFLTSAVGMANTSVCSP